MYLLCPWMRQLSVVMLLLVSCGLGHESLGADEAQSAISGGRSGASRKPVVVYYAVDTREPFMTLAVDFEIHQLRDACRASSHTNWVAVTNSAILEYRDVLVCQDGTYQNRALPADLAEWISQIAGGNWNADYPPQIPRHLSYFDLGTGDKARFYSDYPLTHPAVLYATLRWIFTDVFPSRNYDFFLHLKSHGGSQVVLSALPDQIATERTARQKEEWLGEVQEAMPLLHSAMAGRYERPLVEPEKLGKVGLGRAYDEQGDATLAIPLARRAALGISELGFEMSLDQNLGISGIVFAGILSHLQRDLELRMDGDRPMLQFLLWESCSTFFDGEAAPAETMSYGGNISYYSAPGSLWYRNIDWDSIFSASLSQGVGSDVFELEVKKWADRIIYYGTTAPLKSP